MKEIIDSYLNRRLSRRGFVRSMANWGFSVAATTSVLDSLAPMVAAASSDPASGSDLLPATMVKGTGGDLLLEQLRAAGVRFVFNCNSSVTSAIFDALVDRPGMQVIQVPQEGQMISMAQGFTLASGKIALAVTGSRGFPNALSNMQNAWKDCTPMIIASQKEPAGLRRGRELDQWDDYLDASANFTRWRSSVTQAARVPEATRRALKMASTPPEGPVALAFAPQVLSANGAEAAIVDHDQFMIKPQIKPVPRLVEEAARLLVEAQSPLIIVGPEVTRSGGQLEVIKLAERMSIPVAQGEWLFDDFPTDHPLFLGNYRLPGRSPSGVDLVLKLGSQWPAPSGAATIHVSIDPTLMAKAAPTDVDIVADVKETAADLLVALEAVATRARLNEIMSARFVAVQQHTMTLRARRAQGVRAGWNNNPLSEDRVAVELDQLLEKDAIIVPELTHDTWLGFGENTAMSQLTFAPGAKRKIGRTTGSALGWGVGAAIGVKLGQPDRQVVALQGDGGFMFAQAESLWTMARHEVPVITVIFNNRSYNGPRNKILRQGGRQAQARRDMTCYLGDPDVDFAKVAAGFGVKGEVVRAPDEIRPAVQRAIESTRDGKPYLIDAVVARTGLAADSTWYPKYSLAAARNRKV